MKKIYHPKDHSLTPYHIGKIMGEYLASSIGESKALSKLAEEVRNDVVLEEVIFTLACETDHEYDNLWYYIAKSLSESTRSKIPDALISASSDASSEDNVYDCEKEYLESLVSLEEIEAMGKVLEKFFRKSIHLVKVDTPETL